MNIYDNIRNDLWLFMTSVQEETVEVPIELMDNPVGFIIDAGE